MYWQSGEFKTVEKNVVDRVFDLSVTRVVCRTNGVKKCEHIVL